MSEADKPNDRNLLEPSTPTSDSGSDSGELPRTAPLANAAADGLNSNSSAPEAEGVREGVGGGQLAATPDEDGWETVNLPNTISVDALQQQTVGQAIAAELLDEEGQASSQGDIWLNSQLLKRVAQLERALQECRSYLHRERRQTEALSSQLEQQRQELEAATGELEVVRQEVEAGQVAIANLSQELQFTGERMALMERECALTQQNYQEQSQLKKQLENTCRELRARLHRQQRHTLQFKAALEKCIEKPGSVDIESLATLEPVSSSPGTGADPTGTDQGVVIFSKARPIQPWSAPSDEAIDQLAAKTEEPIKDTIRQGELGQDSSNQLFAMAKDAAKDILDNSPAREAAQDVANGAPVSASNSLLAEIGEANNLGGSDTGSKSRLSADLAGNPPQEGTQENPPESTQENSPEERLINNVEKNNSNPSQAVRSPAPLVYPQASAKKRRSLAAVELPSFGSTEQ